MENTIAPLQGEPAAALQKTSISIPMSFGHYSTNKNQPFDDLSLSNITLIVRQQPKVARACGFGERDRRVVDPPPIVQLHIDNPDLRSEGKYLQESGIHPVVHCSLWDPEKDVYATTVSDSSTTGRQQRRLLGTLISSPFVGEDEHGVPGIFFAFPDLSVRTTGIYCLHFTLVEFDFSQMKPGHSAPVKATIRSDLFPVYNAREFPGLRASTSLSASLRSHGCLPSSRKYRKNLRTRQGNVLSGKGNAETSLPLLSETCETSTSEEMSRCGMSIFSEASGQSSQPQTLFEHYLSATDAFGKLLLEDAVLDQHYRHLISARDVELHKFEDMLFQILGSLSKSLFMEAQSVIQQKIAKFIERKADEVARGVREDVEAQKQIKPLSHVLPGTGTEDYGSNNRINTWVMEVENQEQQQ
ncbi:hypothetical protein ONS96_006379 [Cadophora gregata f. sp. sojae]|nr:hypothetical protein ONS96_006379 [Cadophora gregata f. sp. sojae]